MTDRTHPDSGRIITSSDVIADLQDRIAELEAQLESIGAGGVNGPLIGQPQAMPDLSQLTERGAKAWTAVDAQALREGFAAEDMATASAQGFRDGVAFLSANAGEPSGHIKEPYTLAEIKAKIASNDYSAEMLLQHAMLLLDSASLAASAGEPVAWQYRSLRDNGAWFDCTKERFEMRCTQPEIWETRALYAAPPTAQTGGWTKPQRTITYTCPVCAASLERQE